MTKVKPWEQGISSSEYLQIQINKAKKYKPIGKGALSYYISTNRYYYYYPYYLK